MYAIIKMRQLMVLSILVPHFPPLGSGGVPPVPPTILMSASRYLSLVLLQAQVVSQVPDENPHLLLPCW